MPESLKNLLLVLHSSNILLPPTYPDNRTDAQKDLWHITVDRTERLLPTFIDGLFIPEQPPAAPVQVSALDSVETATDGHQKAVPADEEVKNVEDPTSLA